LSKEKLKFEPIWADSLGAKTSCTLVRTPDVSVLIDPGVAVMQPSFPVSWAKKFHWKVQAMRAIKRASKKADVIVISHYHYDHFTDFDKKLYAGKLLLTKNPNEYINDSQRKRAEHFFGNICKHFADEKLENLLQERERKKYGNPLEDIPHARKKDFGDYNSRRKELFKKGQKWFRNRVEKWKSSKLIPELKFRNIEVKFAEGKEFKFGRTRLRFTRALFHGIEFSRVGWVFATVVKRGRQKFLHSSDLDGPIIEDHADLIIRERPNVLHLDGPMTYMFGYMLNRINLNRAVENATRIVEKARTGVMVYDHHLPREPKFRERTEKVWETAKQKRKKVLTVAEFLRKKPVVLD
jgi:hypothetical protein